MPDGVTGARKGDFLILGVLGAGGMGKVYKVRNVLSDRVEAMKILLPDLSDQKSLVDRFLIEIKVLAALHHPNIAELRTALTIDNQLVMIMEFVDGVSIARRLDSGPIPVRDALPCLDQVLAALSYAHKQNIIHRDIKPANMMITPAGMVKLMDFGIARSGTQTGLTMTGTTLGSVSYMSPEQVKCEPIDARSDLYSIGVTFYEIVTGQKPFVDENNFAVMKAHIEQPPRPPIELNPEIPLALNQLILKAMAKDPAQRFQSADALRHELGKIASASSQPTQLLPTAPPAKLETTLPWASLPVSPEASLRAPEDPIGSPFSAPPPPQISSANPPARVSPSPAFALPKREVPATPQASPQNRRRSVIVLIAAIGLAGVVAASFVAPRLLRPHASAHTVPASAPAILPAKSSASAPSSSPSVSAATKVSPCQPGEARCGNKLPGEAVKPSTSGLKPLVSVPQSAQTPSLPQRALPPAAQSDPRAAEESARATADSVAQFVALEHEELDELSARRDKVNARIAALQTLQDQHSRADISASQQRAQNYLAHARIALRNADVQAAQKYMEQASAELDDLEKLIGP